MRKGSKDLSLAERQTIHRMRQKCYGIRAISRSICRAASTVSRELKKQVGKHAEEWYDKARLLHDAYRERRGKKRKRYVILKNSTVQAYVTAQLKLGLSPEIISLRIEIDIPGQSVSHETIYQYIYKYDRSLIKYLLKKGRTRRYSGKGSSRPLRGCSTSNSKLTKRSIEARPQTANDRSEIGHLETDLIVTPPTKGKSALQVTVDRAYRRVILTLVPNRQANEARQKLFQKLEHFKSWQRKTLTADNGSEHADLPLLEPVCGGLEVYYCHAYCSWERGTVEAVNGIIRRKFPKGTNFDNITPQEVKEVENWFNNRPMLVLKGRTPNEVYEKEVQRLSSIHETNAMKGYYQEHTQVF